MPINNIIKIKRGDQSDWSSNPVLALGEPGFDTTNNILKIGDGSAGWNALDPVNIDQHLSVNAASSSDNDGNTFIQDLLLDSYGHVTGITVATASEGGTGGISNVVEDTTPQLGGNLDLLQHNITGIGSVNISGNITALTGSLDVISFNIDNESTLLKGQISWDDTEGVLDVGLTDTATAHIGQHRFYRVRNTTGGVLYKGQVVYATGVHSNGIITPDLYVADNSIDETRFIGMILEDLSDSSNGYVIDFGHVEDLDLDGSATNFATGSETWNNGDILYAHPTSAGKLTNVKPKHAIVIAIILDTGTGNGNGKLFVRPTSHGDLGDNHDVSVSSATDGQFLQYNSSTDYWVPSSSGNFTTLELNGSGVLVEHPIISAASSSDNSGRTYIQDITLDSNGHVVGLSTATETVVDTDTTYTAGTGLFLDGTEFNVSGIETSLLQGTISNNQLTNSSVTITAGTGLANGGSVSLGSSVTIDIDETVIQSGDNVSFLNNDSGYLTSHPTISAASSSDNSGRTYIQDITLDSNGHVIGLATATETVTDTDTTYSAGSGLSLDGTTFNSLTATTTTSGITTLTNTINTDEDKALTPKAVNDAGYLTSHPTISAASSSDNSGRTYIQDITLDSNGHVIGLATATETVTDTDTTYNPGSGLSLDGTTFNALTATTTTSGITTLSNTINSDEDKALTPKAVNDAGYLTAHPTISAASSVDNSNGNVIQDITLDSNGHVTVLGSIDLDSRYYTESEIDAFNYVDGGGTANYVAKWSDTDTLTSGIIYDDGTDVGIGTVSPGYKLDVNGTFSANSINVNDAFTFPTADGSADQYLKTDGLGNVTWSTIAGGGGGISNVVEDTTPQLGGTLDLNGNNIEGYAFQTTPTGTIIGASGWIYQSGQQVLSNGSFGTHIGDAQFTQNILRAQTTDATLTNLTIGTQSGILLASNRTYNFTVNVVGRRTNGQDNAGYKLEGLLFNDGYGTEILGNPVKTTYYESDTTWDATVAVTGAGAGGTDYLLVRCQGAASKDINWVAHVDMLEVGGNITNYTEANILGVNSKIVP